MLRTRKAASLVSALVALAVTVVLAGCSVENSKDGSKEKVRIETPIGGLNVNTDASAKDTGIAVYPGAKQKTEHNGANVNLSSSMVGMKLAVVEYLSEDPPDKVKDYYKKELTKFGGPVLECANGVRENSKSDEITCSDKPQHGQHQSNQLAVGTKQRQHIVSIEPDGKGTKFALIYMQLRGEEGAL